jgi:hypothetical protein
MYAGGVEVPAGWSLISSPDCGAINFPPLVWPPLEGCWIEWHESVFDETNYTIGPVVRREQIDCGPVPPQGWDSMSFNPQEGDVVYTFDNARQHFQSHTFHNGAWDRLPAVGLGQACFVWTAVPRVIRTTGPMPL